MSRNTSTRTHSSSSVPNRQSSPEVVGAVRTRAEEQLWKVLHDSPPCTATDLSHAAAIGQSTAAKILAKWAKDGIVTRTAGIAAAGGRRAADLWSISQVDHVDHGPVDAERAAVVAPLAASAAVPCDHPASDPGKADEDAAKPVAESLATSGSTGSKEARLARGALRGMVLDFLRNHPDEELAPTTIAKALGGKSAGAVSNALDKLVSDGAAARVSDSPRRYRSVTNRAPVAQPTK